MRDRCRRLLEVPSFPPVTSTNRAVIRSARPRGSRSLSSMSTRAGNRRGEELPSGLINAGKDGIPCLVAKCHERNATRTFRIDRIKCCIDFTGEVFDDVPAFLSDTFGMSEVRAASREEPETARWRNILNIVRADAVLLAAMSRSDGSVRPVETDAAVDHLSYIIEHEGEFLSGKDVGRIWHHVHSLRPGLQAIDRALGDLSSRSPDRIKRLIMAAVAVMDADGQRHQAEARMLNELARELLGITLF